MKEQQVLLGTIQRLLKGGLKNSSCFYVNNSTARRFYYHTEHVHGGRREFHGDRVKKTTSSLETCVGEIENGNYKVLSPLYPRIYCGQLTNRDKGASSWLTTVPLVDQGLALNKQEFRDSPRLSHNMPLSDLPSKCICGEKYTVCHALSCKKEGFARGAETPWCSQPNVEVEPELQPLDNERFNFKSAVTSPASRLDLKAGDFWSRVATAFFDVRVTHVNSKCNQGKAISTIFKEQEEKKRKYQQRLLDVEMRSFTPLDFGTNGGMGVDCHCFLKRLAEKL